MTMFWRLQQGRDLLLIHLSIKRRQQPLFTVVLILMVPLLGSCASSGTSAPAANASERILACKSTDIQVASEGQCLQDDAACYQISSGQWCTGERGNVCPAGSQALTAGVTCPTGARCFRFSESLECVIN